MNTKKSWKVASALAAVSLIAGCGGDNLSLCDGCPTPTPVATATLSATPTVTFTPRATVTP